MDHPTIEERNEGYIPPRFDMSGGKLGVTPILWKFRMAYRWSDDLAEQDPFSDQCCTTHVFALTESEARRAVWDKFKIGNAVMPEAIASCRPVRFRAAIDDELDAQFTQGIEAGTGETARLDPQDESPVASGDAPDHPTIDDYRNRLERAEAECKELREHLKMALDVLKLEGVCGDECFACGQARNALNGS